MTLTHPFGFMGAGVTPPSLEYLARYETTANLITYTFSSVDFGSNPSPTRLIVVTAIFRKTASVTSATIGGVAATIAIQTTKSSNDYCHAIFSAVVPTGTSGNVVINLADSGDSAAISVYALDGLSSNTVVNTQTDGTVPLSVTETTSGVTAVIATSGNYQVVTAAWTGTASIVEDNDGTFDSILSFSSASVLTSAALSSDTIIATLSGSLNKPGLLTAVWE